MSRLLEFLTENTVEDIAEKVYISERFKDEDGELLAFTVKPVPSKEYNELQKKHSKIKKKGNVEFNSDAFNMDLITNYTVEPNFRDVEALKKVGCVTPDQFINKTLLAGECSKLAEKIGEISGFNEDMDELREEAKN